MADAVTPRSFSDAVASQFAVAIESVIGSPVSAVSAAPPQGGGWIVRLSLTGDLRGTLALWIDRSDAATLAARVMGSTSMSDDATVADMLREMWTQAAGATTMTDPFTGVSAAVSGPAAGSVASATLSAYALRMSDGEPVRLAAWGDVALAPAAVTTPVVGAAANNPKLEVVLDIDLPLIVRFGRTTMSLKSLAGLGPGSIVDMGRSPDEPVEMLVGDRVIARGEVVIVAGNYGVRITDLISSADRARALEA